MRISDHFRKQEFEKSATAMRLGISNTVTEPELLANMVALAANVLEPLRAKWGPVSLSSGYRHPDLCVAVPGGVVQRGHVRAVERIRVGVRSDQLCDDLSVAVIAGDV